MGKNILIISTSPRVGSNSELLASEFAKGAAQAGLCLALAPVGAVFVGPLHEVPEVAEQGVLCGKVAQLCSLDEFEFVRAGLFNHSTFLLGFVGETVGGLPIYRGLGRTKNDILGSKMPFFVPRLAFLSKFRNCTCKIK